MDEAGNSVVPGSSVVGVDRDDAAPPPLVLTWDDGPDPAGTPAVMEALAEAGAHATFFVLLTRTRLHRTVLAECVAAGHEIALHGPDHARLTRFPSQLVEMRTRDARAELEDQLGREVRWIRPPYGAQDAATWAAVTRTGLTPVMWSAVTEDWFTRPMDAYVETARPGLVPGGVLLSHDGFAGRSDGAIDDFTPPTVDRGELARRILHEAADRGLHAMSLGGALEAGAQLEHRTWLSD